ncbi:MAG: ribonuclease P protein component [Alphaproteobacteria bacterium]|nr:ribonuclease P protein component [Alphaproteobacteria bacterium]
MSKLGRLKQRAEFLRLAGSGRKAASPGLVLQAGPRPDQGGVFDSKDLPRIGFTCSRKVGNAVARNRARRRLKAAADQVLAQHAREDYDFVIIGRTETLVRPFALLLQDLLGSLKRVGAMKPANPQDGQPAA